jgi:hypothetical protein
MIVLANYFDIAGSASQTPVVRGMLYTLTRNLYLLGRHPDALSHQG